MQRFHRAAAGRWFHLAGTVAGSKADQIQIHQEHSEGALPQLQELEGSVLPIPLLEWPNPVLEPRKVLSKNRNSTAVAGHCLRDLDLGSARLRIRLSPLQVGPGFQSHDECSD
jgi:hypothetical protein